MSIEKGLYGRLIPAIYMQVCTHLISLQLRTSLKRGCNQSVHVRQ